MDGHAEVIKLNIGCGNTKMAGYTGLDLIKTHAVDIVCDFTREELPFPDNSVDHVVMSHVIEHIQEMFHERVLGEIWRVLKPGHEIFLAYPEFKQCALNYINNYKGMRDYWKMTIYGRQAHPGDFHVTIMDTPLFVDRLKELGFEVINWKSEQEFNTILRAKKSDKPTSREALLAREIFDVEVEPTDLFQSVRAQVK